MEKSKFSEEALKKLYISTEKLSCFTKEELDAICCYIPMTEKIFDSCLAKAILINNYEVVEYLESVFPEFAILEVR